MEAVPYQLDATKCASGEWIIVRGPEEILRHFRGVKNVKMWGDENAALPASRLNFLVAEAVGVPQEVSKEYRTRRRATVANVHQDVRYVEGLLHQRGEGGFALGLLPHQLEFLSFASMRRVAFNASEQGTGKTRMALGMALVRDCRRILVMCPKEVSDEWASAVGALQKPPFFLDLANGPIRARAEDLHRLRRAADLGAIGHRMLATVNYEALQSLRADLSAWRPDMIVADESWKIKTPNTQRTRSALWLVAPNRPDGGPCYRVCLAGTPIGNHVGDLYPQLKFLDPRLAPETYRGWLARFAEMEQVRIRGGQLIPKPVGLLNPTDLMARLEPVWFRATKELCLKLPPKQRHTVEVDLTPEQRRLYREVERDGDAALGVELALTPPAVRDIRLQQIAGGHRPHPAEEERGWRNCEPISCAKMEWLLRWANTILEPHPSTRCIIFCKFNAEVRRIAEELARLLGPARVAAVTGQGGPYPAEGERLTSFKREFNSRAPGSIQVIVAQVKKMAAGHNLQAADHVVYFSNDWSWIYRDQSEDRAHRLGREDTVQYWDIVARGTVDEDVRAALARKQDFAGRLAPATATGDSNDA